MSNRVKGGRGRRGRGPAAWALAATAALSSGATWSGTAHAQRGEAYTLKEALKVRPGPNDGFPGAFDTQLARRRAFVGNLPTLNLYYGVTDDLSVGTSVLSFLPLLGGTPGGALYARYRLGSTSWFRTTADVLLGGARAAAGHVGVSLVGSNTEFALTRWQHLTLNGWFGHIEARFSEVDLDLNLLLLGGTYSLVFARWGAFHLTGLYLASGNFAIGGLDGTTALDFSGAGSATDRIVARGTFSLRAGSWLFDLGAVRLGGALLPWAGISFEVGG